MKNKIILILICFLLFITGCAVNDNPPEKETEPYGKYTANGRIVKIDKDGFHIQGEDNVEPVSYTHLCIICNAFFYRMC